jgi:hypothetical protein
VEGGSNAGSIRELVLVIFVKIVGAFVVVVVFVLNHGPEKRGCRGGIYTEGFCGMSATRVSGEPRGR